MLLLYLNAHACLLLKPPFLCFVILYGYVLLFKYILHCTRSESMHHTILYLAVLCTYFTRSGNSSSSILRVNHVSLFLLITTSYVIYIYEKYIVSFGAMYSKIVFNACDSLYLGHISSTLATKN